MPRAISSVERWKRIKKARKRIEEIDGKEHKAYFIHYSCESFHKEDTRSPKITSIAVRSLVDGQTKSYSISKYAEKLKLIDEIDTKFEAIEKAMLKDFFRDLRLRKDSIYIHWNMRDANYGFQAIEHRAAVLGVSPFEVSVDCKFDLARAMVDLYGKGYAGHPRLDSLVQKNKMTGVDALAGAEEAICADRGEYRKLHLSTLRKVDWLHNIYERAQDGSLKTESTFRERNGWSLASIGTLIKEHPYFSLLAFVFSLVSLILAFTSVDLSMLRSFFENLKQTDQAP